MLMARSGPVRPGGGVAVVGILNLTPDSFSDGGRHSDAEAAVERGEGMVAEGADVIDLGAESTRPGAISVPLDEELRRLLPVLRKLRARVRTPISIDTSKAEVARAAIDLGADIINDVTAATGDSRMLETVRRGGTSIVLMHMQGRPATMQDAPTYAGDDPVPEVVEFLAGRARAACQAGISPERIVLDPGLGFGKTTLHNLTLIDRLTDLVVLGYPVLVGPSRKRFLGDLTGDPAPERLHGTMAVLALIIDRGAVAVRVHDVGPAVRVARVVEAVHEARRRGMGAGRGPASDH